MASQMLLIYSTCPDRASAERIADHLVDRHLAACVSILPGLTSVYCWEGKKEHSEEHLLLIKSTEGRYQKLEQAIREQHPYELPEIIAVPVQQGLPGYIHWINQCTEE